MEQCANCGTKERHLQVKRGDWQADVRDEGSYEVYCPDCREPDPDPCRTLDEFVSGGAQ